MSNPTTSNSIISNPHLDKWKQELQEVLDKSIQEKLCMTNEIKHFEEIQEKKNTKIQELDTIYTDTTNYVKKRIKKYITSTNNIIEELHTIEEKNHIELFALYKKMYKDAVSFFSQKDFTYHESKLDDTNTHSIFSFFDEEQVWTNVQLSIWSQEILCKDIEKQKKILEKKYNTLLENYTIQKELYDNLEKNIQSLEKKIQDIHVFSTKITKDDELEITKDDELENNNESVVS